MKVYMRYDFVSWEENGHTATALVNSDGWFEAAINCWRDGDMGDTDEDGICERIWWGDNVDIGDPDATPPRPATNAEARLWLKKIGSPESLEMMYGMKVAAVVMGCSPCVIAETEK